MDKKTELMLTLGVKLTDADVEVIKEGYRQVYDRPEEYTDDKLVDLICAELGKEVPKTLKEIFGQVDGVDITRSDYYDTIAWGRVGDNLVYALRVMNQFASGAISATRDSEQGRIAVYIKNKLNVLVVVFDGIRSKNDMPFIPGYSLLYLTDWSDVAAHEFFVPFMRAGKGYNPVMWIDFTATEKGGTSQAFQSLEEGWVDWAFVMDAKKLDGAYAAFKSAYPGINLESDPNPECNRLVRLSYDGTTVIYNRNSLSYSGNITDEECLFPFYHLVCRRHGFDKTEINAVPCLSGGLWEDFYFAEKSVVQDVPTEEQPQPVKTVIKDTDVDNKELGNGNKKSIIGRMLDNASSDYKQVDIKR